MTKCWFWERKELFTWNKNHFASILSICLSLKQTKTTILEGESPTLVLRTKEKVKWHKACKREAVLFLYKINSWYVGFRNPTWAVTRLLFFYCLLFLTHRERDRDRDGERDWKIESGEWMSHELRMESIPNF